jgi:fatty-acyl-CoA synthase
MTGTGHTRHDAAQDGLSHARGSTAVPLLNQTIGDALRAAAQRWGDGLALVSRHQDIRWTWAQFDHQVDRIASGLIAQGVGHGDRVGIWAPNCAEWAVIQFATARIGAILVTINPAYRTSEVEFAINKVGATVLVTAAQFKTSDYIAMLREIWPVRVPTLRLVVTLGDADQAGCMRWADLAREPDRAALDAAAAGLDPHDAINIQFTSGTTGLPKGATLSHRNILNNGFFDGEMMHYSEVDKVCIPVPMYHCFGMVIGALACVTHGSAIVFPGEGFDPLATLKAVAAERCTSLYGVPTMFIAELDHPEFSTFDLSSLRTGMMAGAPCPIEVMRRCVRDMHLTEMTIGYGMTETSPVSTQTAIGDPIEKQTGTVGRVHPHAEIKIVDAEGRIVPRGVSGELCTRGYCVMLGYWDDPERTAQAIDKNGWMHTGDLATMDVDGYLNIVGRIKDMVIRGGENIYPREIEEFLYRHPAIQDVQVFGVPDQRFGEELCAWIKVRSGMALTADEVKAFCKDQIAHYKVPRHIQFVDEFPMTVTGKMQKFIMREKMTEILGVTAAVTA